MSKNLVIVESPAKAKTIEKFLGKDYTVKSSFGHIRDLPSKGMSIDIEGGTFEPVYEVSNDKKKTVSELKKAVKTADMVWLAADEDREGEAIAWHLSEALKLEDQKTKRIVFHEITKTAIQKAVKNPRKIDKNLVDAQQARRVLDRLVGYELSPVLWRKVKAGLSAGRVQSVAVRLIVDREREIEAFEGASKYKVTAEFDLGEGKNLKAELPTKFDTEEEARKFLEKCIGAEFTVANLETKPGKKTPSSPFTTSTLQQEASRKLSFSVKQTMMVAQKLYEAGKITYMRTDSVNLSDQALAQAGEVIEKNFGKEYVKIRKYKTKSASAQEAHEAIRPTDFSQDTAGSDRNEQRLYDLIWKRTIASQMAEAKIEKTVATIDISTTEASLTATGEVLKFEGFLKVYFESSDDEDEESVNPLETKMLPPIKEGQKLDLEQMLARESFTRPPARYTEASLVKKMEEMGIGRPSTYAPTISTIQNREYVEKKSTEGHERKYKVFSLKGGANTVHEQQNTETTGAEKNKLFPTEIGSVVNDFLVNHFSDVVDFHFTAKVEEEFDKIASGKEVWNKMIADFYGGFHQTVEEAADISREEAVGTRELGTDPKTGKPVVARLGRFGPMIQIGTKDDEEKPQFASIPQGKKMEEVTLEEALAMFEFPRKLGKDKEGEEVTINTGRFGPYVKCGKVNASLGKTEDGQPRDPFSVTLEEALELIEEKKKAIANRNVKEFDGSSIKILRGPYGIYITDGKKNAKIPKDVENPAKLTREECEKIIAEAPAKKRGGFRKKKKTGA